MSQKNKASKYIYIYIVIYLFIYLIFSIYQVSYVENINSLLETLHGGSWHEGMTSLDQQYQLFASTGAIKFPVDQTEAWKEKVGAWLRNIHASFVS